MIRTPAIRGGACGCRTGSACSAEGSTLNSVLLIERHLPVGNVGNVEIVGSMEFPQTEDPVATRVPARATITNIESSAGRTVCIIRLRLQPKRTTQENN